MSTSEDKIIEALQRHHEGEEVDTLSGILTDMLRKQSFFLRAFPVIGIVVFLGLAVYAAVRFTSSQNVQEWIAYATLFLIAIVAVTMIKLWVFLVWVRNSLMREIKRLELRCITGIPSVSRQK
jgi:uncharacterized membrane protein